MIAQAKSVNLQKKCTPVKIIGEVCMLLLCLVVVLPFYYLFISTFKTQEEVSSNALALPHTLYLDNYISAFQNMEFLTAFKNTLLITICTLVIVIVLGSMAAYAIARRKHKIYKILMLYFLLGFMVPVQTTMVPLFQLMQNLGMINSIPGLIILASGGCSFALFLYQGFINGIPVELDEAAQIDGASPFKTFWVVIFPLLKPITITMIIFHVMGTWNDFLNPFLFLSSRENTTLMLEMYRGVGEFVSSWSIMMASMVVIIAPLVIFYIFAQKYIIEGLVNGAVKG